MHPAAKARKGGHIVAEMRPSFRMTIGTDPGQVAEVGAAFARFAEGHAVPAAIRRSVSVALDELLSNTLTYGFTGRDGGEVRIEVELAPDRVRVTLTDDGKPFNPLDLGTPDTTRSVTERRPGGLGVHLARRMMDEVAYHRRGDRNVVTLAKLLP